MCICIYICLYVRRAYIYTCANILVYFPLTYSFSCVLFVCLFIFFLGYTFLNNTFPFYLNEIFEFTPHCSIGTRNNVLNLNTLFIKQIWEKLFLVLVPPIWNSLPDSIKRTNSLNTFKHNVKKHYLT